MRDILKALWFTPGLGRRWGLPLLVRGAPGTAKSAQVSQLAKECGLHCEVVLASLRQPEDFLGLPIPRGKDRNRVEYAPPAWALRASEAERAVVFLDEINTAPPAVQAALLRVVLDGVVGDLQLPPTVRFVAACNPVEDAAGGWDLAAPLANRFGHAQWPGVDADAWSTYLLGGAGSADVEPLRPAAEEASVEERWPEFWAHAAGSFAGFAKARSSLLLQQPPSGDPKASGAWPSPRTWEMAARAYAGARLHSMTPVDQEAVVAMYVGNGAAGELATYLEQLDLPDPKDVLDGKVSWKHNPKRLDRTSAVLGSCASLVCQTAKTAPKEWRAKVWTMLGEMVADAADVAVPPARALAQARIGLDLAEARPVLGALFPITEAEGRR